MRLVLAEHDQGLAREIQLALAPHCDEIVHASTLAEARQRVFAARADILVLDMALPGGDAHELCRVMRRASLGCLVIALVAGSTADEHVNALEAGADACVAKPNVVPELVARVRALHRGRLTGRGRVVTVADLEVDLAGHRVWRAGQFLELSAKEFLLLALLVLHRSEVVRRETIIAYVWAGTPPPSRVALDVLVSRLRRKIDRRLEKPLIKTVKGVGFRIDY